MIAPSCQNYLVVKHFISKKNYIHKITSLITCFNVTMHIFHLIMIKRRCTDETAQFENCNF